MEPKDKANQLVSSMIKWQFNSDDWALHLAKQSALIAVEEIINNCKVLYDAISDMSNSFNKSIYSFNIDWWQQVKIEIGKI